MSNFHIFDVTNSIDHELPTGKTVVGRSPECGIRVISSSVSRKHAMFELSNDRLTFSDLGSSNGSFVNGQPVKTTLTLQNGDDVVMGELRFSVTDESAGPAQNNGTKEEATQLSASDAGDEEIPSVWSENAGLEQASGTQFFAETDESEAMAAYRQGKIASPAIGNSPRLVGLNGESRAQIFELGAGDKSGDSQTWKIGRDADSVDIVIPDASVSGQHAQLVNEGRRWKIVNWMSTNGTFVNGNKGLSTYLKNADVIRMGSAELAFELPTEQDDTPAAQDTARESSDSGILSRFMTALRGLFKG